VVDEIRAAVPSPLVTTTPLETLTS